MSIDSAYRRLAIAILELDVATLTAKLAAQAECSNDHARPSDTMSTSTTPIGAIIFASSPSARSFIRARRASAARRLTHRQRSLIGDGTIGTHISLSTETASVTSRTIRPVLVADVQRGATA